MRTASERLPPAAAHTVRRFSRHCRAWSPGVAPTSSPVSASSGIWPEQNSRPPALTAWLYGPTAAGASSAVTTWRWCDIGATVAGGRRAERPRRRDLAVPAPAPGEPRRLAALGRRGAAPGARPRPPAARLDRLQRVPLVPRDGARVLRGSRDRRADERALRVRQGRPRGAARRRRGLHGGRAGDDRPGRLAAQRLLHPRAGAVLRRDVLPARAPPRDAELAPGADGRGRGVDDAARGDPRALRPDARATARRGGAAAVGGAVR